MAEVKFYKVASLPTVPEANAWYLVINGDYADTYVTDNTGNPKMVGNSTMITEIINSTPIGNPHIVEDKEIFYNLISGNTLTITNYQTGDTVFIFRNGLLKRDTYDFVRTANSVTFINNFGSSSGSLNDGETVTIVLLRIT